MSDSRMCGDYFGALDKPYTTPYEEGTLKVKRTFYVVVVKRFFDIAFSLPALILTAPINLIIAIITYATLGSPILFSHYRPGLGEKPIKISKFRNMTEEKDENGELLPANLRITKVGAFFRKTSMDELLQFWLIFIGKMSIIGPRPLLMCYLPEYTLEQHKRHAVRPGLECPLPGHYGDVSWKERIDNDLWYVENISFKTDVIMLIRLFKLVFNVDRTKVRGETTDDYFSNN